MNFMLQLCIHFICTYVLFVTFSIDCIDAIFDGLLGDTGHSDTLPQSSLLQHSVSSVRTLTEGESAVSNFPAAMC